MIRTEHERAILDLLAQCSDDEVRVVHALLRRVHRGRRAYGPLRLARDQRDFRHEAACEAFDGLWYLAVEDVQRQRQEPSAEAAQRVREAIAARRE